jgi:hypothetical protein
MMSDGTALHILHLTHFLSCIYSDSPTVSFDLPKKLQDIQAIQFNVPFLQMKIQVALQEYSEKPDSFYFKQAPWVACGNMSYMSLNCNQVYSTQSSLVWNDDQKEFLTCIYCDTDEQKASDKN